MKSTLTILVCVFASFCSSQTEQINQDKYWKYREMLKCKFVKVGNLAGESIPMACRIPGYAFGGVTDPNGTQLQWKDATITLGYYLVVLATENKLLDDASENTDATMSELYYALNAINRLDLNAEFYFSEGGNTVTPDDLNGFFIRDDVRHEMALNFANDPPIPNGPIQPDPGHPNQMRSDFEGWTNYDSGGMGDEVHTTEPQLGSSESLDQLTSIFARTISHSTLLPK